MAGLHGELMRIEPKRAHLVGLGGHGIFPEKVVKEQVLGPRALLGVQHQYRIDKVDAEVVGVPENPAEALLGGPWKRLGRHHKAAAGKLVVALPVLLGRRAAELGNLEKLVEIVLSLRDGTGLATLQDGAPGEELRHYAADAPDVHRRRVVAHAEQNLHGPVPARAHGAGVARIVGSLHCPGKPLHNEGQKKEKRRYRNQQSSRPRSC